MRALPLGILLVFAVPAGSAGHPGCEPDPSFELGFARVECESEPHHEGTMYTKRVEVALDSDHPFDLRVMVEHKYSTAAHASTCRITLGGPVDTTIGPPCAGGHDPLLP